MRKIVFAFILLASTAIFVLPSCKKTDQPPTIDLEEPADSAIFALTDSIHIEGMASDDNDLHTFTVLLTYMGDTVFSDFPYVHGTKTYLFHYHVIPASAGPYHLTVKTEDHANHEAVVERDITVTP